MITLHRHRTDQQADKIEKKFNDLVLAYEVEEFTDEEREPFIEDGDKKIKGKSDMEAWLRQLENDLDWQRSLSGDGCYIHPETGEVC